MINSSYCPLRKIYKIVFKKLGRNEYKVRDYNTEKCHKCIKNCDRIKFEIIGMTGNLRLF